MASLVVDHIPAALERRAPVEVPGLALGLAPGEDIEVVVTTTDPQGNPVTDRGKYVVVWKKQPDGSWKAISDIFNSDLPAPSAQ